MAKLRLLCHVFKLVQKRTCQIRCSLALVLASLCMKIKNVTLAKSICEMSQEPGLTSEAQIQLKNNIDIFQVWNLLKNVRSFSLMYINSSLMSSGKKILFFSSSSLFSNLQDFMETVWVRRPSCASASTDLKAGKEIRLVSDWFPVKSKHLRFLRRVKWDLLKCRSLWISYDF